MIFQFKIQLQGISKPPVWRRVKVGENYTFEDFHHIIQILFDWDGYHLYLFSDKTYGGNITIQENYEDDWGNEGHIDPSRIRLNEVFTNEKDVFYYVYDFGDSWEHKITLEAITDEGLELPDYIGGKGKTPPEDIGGNWGYAEMKEAIKDPNHESYEFYSEYLEDEGWDPNEFDIDSINIKLEDFSTTGLTPIGDEMDIDEILKDVDPYFLKRWIATMSEFIPALDELVRETFGTGSVYLDEVEEKIDFLELVELSFVNNTKRFLGKNKFANIQKFDEFLVAQDLGAIRDKLEANLASGYFDKVLEIAQALIVVIPEYWSKEDDSEGKIKEIFDYAVKVLQFILSEEIFDEDEMDDIYSWYQVEMGNKIKFQEIDPNGVFERIIEFFSE